jgi:hypothetical protein
MTRNYHKTILTCPDAVCGRRVLITAISIHKSLESFGANLNLMGFELTYAIEELWIVSLGQE